MEKLKNVFMEKFTLALFGFQLLSQPPPPHPKKNEIGVIFKY